MEDPWLTGKVASTKLIANAALNIKRFNVRRKFRYVCSAWGICVHDRVRRVVVVAVVSDAFQIVVMYAPSRYPVT